MRPMEKELSEAAVTVATHSANENRNLGRAAFFFSLPIKLEIVVHGRDFRSNGENILTAYFSALCT